MKITKKDIIARLQKYRLINELFSRSLAERKDGNWFRNIIIWSLYIHPEYLQGLEAILEVVFEKTENAKLLMSKLDGKEEMFDQKVWHVYAEILAAKWFVDREFENVKFVESIKDRPSPDIELCKDKIVHFAEVKYLELTADELTPILSQLEELAIEHPDIYENKSFAIEVQTPFAAKLKRIRNKEERDGLIDKLIKGFHEKIKSEKRMLKNVLNAKQKYLITIEDPWHVEFQIEESKRFVAFLFHPNVYNHKLTVGTEFFHYGPLYAKLIGRIHEAYLQILTKRNDEFDLVRNDFIYLYIENRGTDILYQENVVEKVNQLLEALKIEKLVQVITNYDKIMKIDEQLCPAFSKISHEPQGKSENS